MKKESKIILGKTNYLLGEKDGQKIWLLCDYMQTFYTLRKTAETFRHGYSYFTGRAKIDDLQRVDLENEINQNMLPKLFAEIEKLLTPNEN